MDNIYPIHHQTLNRLDKEALLHQKGVVLWMVGLSGSGKSTLAKMVQLALHEKGILTQILDGDNLRSGLNSDLGFSKNDRQENIRRAAEVAKLFGENGIVTICSFISPTDQIRQQAKNIVGDHLWHDVYIKASLEICEKRDVKGLYQKARKGEIKDFTGIDSPFEPPTSPALVVDTGEMDATQSTQYILDYIKTIIKL